MTAPKLKAWTLDILGKRFTVSWRKISDKAYGECTARMCQIVVDPTSHPEQQKDTLLHEALHAIDHEMHAKMRERQVRRMATGLLHFMRANPEVIRWMAETD